MQDFVRDAVRELRAVRPRRVQPAEHADDRVDRLAAERWQPIHQDYRKARARGLDRGGDARGAGADHADVAAALTHRRLLGARHDPRFRIKRTVQHLTALTATWPSVPRPMRRAPGSLAVPGACRIWLIRICAEQSDRTRAAVPDCPPRDRRT